MSQSEVSLSETRALARLRGHRADRAERMLQQALIEQRALDLRIEQARAAVEQASDRESRQRVELLHRYQGQAVSRHMLSGWNETLHKVSAQTAEQQGVLRSLLERQPHQVSNVERARKQVSASQRQVEKLRELSILLAEEGAWPSHQD